LYGTNWYGAANGAATSSTGGGGAHNNVQPTMVLNFIIKA
jgi:microcystin-dependent protein